MTEVIWPLVKALAQGHDERRLRAKMAHDITSLWLSIPHTPAEMAERIQKLVSEPELFTVGEAEEYADALTSVIKEDEPLMAELVALDLTIARLGGLRSASRIGWRVIQELRAMPASSDP